ncbi:mechanosensitive ion channel family protein [Natrarchaeobaculum aegyptiacum]|uniref:Mechanosensitive ion channel protein n=1 Tax=Natrarchaeobaculum aegyptiacum TaxID=745377 RepID=A0A2Z2HWH5_9EURY|nr:mechanosensitive ion channel family protein [Natrarchaeobaculum aegyptiacum]ARS91706.1 mechanosensitive ion channel protein [Natrarchaeobaculum aegyptiacum]
MIQFQFQLQFLLQTDPPAAATLDLWGIGTSILLFAVGFLAVLALGKTILVPAVDRALRSREFDEVVHNLATSGANLVVWVGAVVVALTVAGYGAFLSAFAIFGGAIGLAVGFAAQDLVGNFVAGIFILQDRPFEVGDWIEWEDRSGRVEEIDLRVTRVRTFDNERITVPNSELANNAVTNPVAYDTLRQKFVFGIGYDDDVDEATDIILEAAADHPDILDDPAPSVRLVELGDSDVGLQARWWIANPERSNFVGVRSEYVQTVKEAFDDAGIDIPYVHRELTGSVEVVEQQLQ